jgi:hypothetical protein
VGRVVTDPREDGPDGNKNLHADDAEREVLEYLLTGTPAAQEVFGLGLTGDEFFHDANRAVVRIVKGMVAAGEALAFDDIAERIEADRYADAAVRGAESAGAKSYLSGLSVGHFCAPADIPARCERIARKAAQRKLIADLEGITQEARGPGASLTGIAARLGGVKEAAEAVGKSGLDVEYLDLTADAPPVEWIIPGWLSRSDILIQAADAYTGKSTLSAALEISVVTGVPWLGITPAITGTVLHFDEEQKSGGILRMYQLLGDRLGLRNHPNFLNLKVASCQGISLGSEAGRDRLERQVAEHRPTLVTFDTVSQVFAGVDLFSMGEVNRAIAPLLRMREKYNTAFNLLTHNRKMQGDARSFDPLEGMYGSVAFRNLPDSIWLLKRDGETSLELRQRKRRDSDERMSMRVLYNRDETGITLSSETIVQGDSNQDKAELWVKKWLGGRTSSRVGEMDPVADADGFDKRMMERGRAQLVKTGVLITHPTAGLKRGEYALKDRPATTPEAAELDL